MPSFEEFSQFLRTMEDGDEGDSPKISVAGEIEVLRDAHRRYLIAHKFAPGSIIQMKQNHEVYNLKGNKLAIVVEVLDEPIVNPDARAGTAFFHEKMDLVIGVLDEDQDLSVLHVSSLRFEPYAPGSAKRSGS